MKTFISVLIILFLFCTYVFVGTSERVNEIKQRVPNEISSRGWKILRYEGYQLGSLGNHGGLVWYHVQDTNRPDIQYRVYVTLWDGELHYHYNQPEVLNRINVDVK